MSDHFKDLIRVEDINNYDDFKLFLNENFDFGTVVTTGLSDITDNIEAHPYRMNSVNYLRFLARVFLMAAEFGFSGLEAFVCKSFSLHEIIVDKSQTDVLDPRVLLWLAQYLGNLILIQNSIKLEEIGKYIDFKTGNDPKAPEDLLEKIEWLRKVYPSEWDEVNKRLETMIFAQMGVSRGKIDKAQVDILYAVPSRIYYKVPTYIPDFNFSKSVSNIPPFHYSEIPLIRSDEFSSKYMPKVREVFNEMDMDSIFEVEFKENPIGVSSNSKVS